MSSKHVGAVADRVAIWIMHSVYSNLFKEFVLSLKRRSFRAAKSLLIQWRKVKWMRMLIKMHCLLLSRSLADWWSRNTVFGPERFELKFDPNNKKVKVIWSINLAILQQYCMCGGEGGWKKTPDLTAGVCIGGTRYAWSTFPPGWLSKILPVDGSLAQLPLATGAEKHHKS